MYISHEKLAKLQTLLTMQINKFKATQYTQGMFCSLQNGAN